MNQSTNLGPPTLEEEEGNFFSYSGGYINIRAENIYYILLHRPARSLLDKNKKNGL